MNFIIFIGFVVLFYTAVQYLFMRKKLEIERLEFIIFLIPVIISVKDYVENRPHAIEWLISLAVSYIMLSVFVFIFIKLAGLPMQTNCDFDTIKKFFDRDKNFSLIKNKKSDIIFEYTDINDDIIRISKRSRNITNLTIKGNMKTIWALRKLIITKVSKLDKGMSKEYYINGIVGAAILIIIGAVMKFFI